MIQTMKSAALTSTVLLAAMTAIGCSTPPHELAETGPAKVFHSPAPTDVVFRQIVRGARTCHPVQQIDADYFPDNKSARVALSTNSGINIVSILVADITPADAGSRVRVAYLKRNPEFVTAVESWSKGDYSICLLML